jgi:dihydrodipicolinate synthase/N-acetylneuraminate lyase
MTTATYGTLSASEHDAQLRKTLSCLHRHQPTLAQIGTRLSRAIELAQQAKREDVIRVSADS